MYLRPPAFRTTNVRIYVPSQLSELPVGSESCLMGGFSIHLSSTSKVALTPPHTCLYLAYILLGYVRLRIGYVQIYCSTGYKDNTTRNGMQQKHLEKAVAATLLRLLP